MAFRQSALPSLPRRYSSPSQQLSDNDVLLSPTRPQQGHYEPQLGPISDFGSLNTIAQSGEEELTDIVEDIDDLDSLDEGLQEFRDTPAFRTSEVQNGTILPAHDGLGSFHPAKTRYGQDSILDTENTNAAQLKFNNALASRFDELDNENWDEDRLERSRHERIEQWRLEQSKIVLEEIEKERQKAQVKQRLQESRLVANTTQNEGLDHRGSEEAGSDSIWQQLAKHVMKDLIGVDDVVLSAIFGEDLMPEEELSKTPTPDKHVPRPKTIDNSEESSIWNKLIKELRQLAQNLSSDIPVVKEQLAEQLDYAGIPVSWLEDRLIQSSQPELSVSAQFRPTLPSPSVPTQPTTQVENAIAEQEYWEHAPNLKTVISYLYQRFRSSPTTTKQYAPPTQKAQEALHRAAIIQQCHPLTSRNHHHYHARNKKHLRQSSSSYRAGSFASGIPHFAGLKRRGSSCASWSTKRSRRGESNVSRNYWDLGESTGSGSLIFAGVGTWGEV